MFRPFTIEKSGAVRNISGRGDLIGKRRVEAHAERVALVVVEGAKAAIFAKLPRIGEQSASDLARAFDGLIGIGEVNVKAFRDARRSHCGFPAVNARSLNGQRKENVGVAEHVVIEKVQRVRLEVGEIKSPAANRN